MQGLPSMAAGRTLLVEKGETCRILQWVRLFSTGLVGNGSDHLTTRRFGFGCGIGSGTTPSA
jgi:hypothetical protein